MLKPLIAGNWKMNGLTAAILQAEELIAGLSDNQNDCDVLICPPATLVDKLSQTCAGSTVKTGGQDCHANESGAHTGDISAEMFADLGASYVIVGHSERRTDHGETNKLVKEKALATLRAGIIPIVCVGETLEQRKANKTLEILDDQIANSIPIETDGSKFVIAYEPVWAIGSGLVPEASDIDTAHSFMRKKLSELGVQNAASVRLLYGGSVKPSNAAEILKIENVNGALVGGASLKASDFLGIIRSV